MAASIFCCADLVKPELQWYASSPLPDANISRTFQSASSERPVNIVIFSDSMLPLTAAIAILKPASKRFSRLQTPVTAAATGPFTFTGRFAVTRSVATTRLRFFWTGRLIRKSFN